MTSNRRDFIRRAPAVAAIAAVPAVAGAGTASAADTQHGKPDKPRKEVHYPDGAEPPENPLFSPIVTYGSMVFISGIGAHFEGDIRAHTDHVLNEVERYLESVGSSMKKVLKINVYLNTLDDYDGMNEVFLGRWGPEPGVRTTIAAAAGIPGDSLVEIDCIAVI
ncbi:RidA family protein [Streptomyces endophyticus]|uniref:RidA family protein n=1 Tax=Streptomyces endophyticus TaxID=714166 RepID=A0ABU6FBR2_9ACTN|nr:RidA family protein [Streptomyces endophyticus]MEB8341373.1 RidA family protein [Streptomyces endophyticus]